MKIQFLPYHDSDYRDLSEMVFSLYEEDPEGEPIDEGKIKKTIAESKKNPDKVKLLMMKSGKENIGYAILVYFWSNEYGGNILTIDELYVKKAYRGHGAGTELFAYVEEMDHIVALQLETTPSNHRACSYYKRLGFAPGSNTHLIKRV